MRVGIKLNVKNIDDFEAKSCNTEVLFNGISISSLSMLISIVLVSSYKKTFDVEMHQEKILSQKKT